MVSKRKQYDIYKIDARFIAGSAVKIAKNEFSFELDIKKLEKAVGEAEEAISGRLNKRDREKAGKLDLIKIKADESIALNQIEMCRGNADNMKRDIIFVEFSGYSHLSGFSYEAKLKKEAAKRYDPNGEKLNLLLKSGNDNPEKAIFKQGFSVLFENGKKAVKFIRFEKSQSMAKACTMAFINSEIAEKIKERITLGLASGLRDKKVVLSKWHAYCGLAMSSAQAVDIELGAVKVIVAADGIINGNAVKNLNLPIITAREVIRRNKKGKVMERRGKGGKKYAEYELEKGKIKTSAINQFDGCGLIDINLAKLIEEKLTGEKKGEVTSIQFRMPYCKGMLNAVDYKTFFIKELELEKITDVYGKEHNVGDVDIILTESQFKAKKWFDEVYKEDPWGKYWHFFKEYGHKFFVVKYNKTDAQQGGIERLNYQVLSTLDADEEQFEKLLDSSMDTYGELKKNYRAQFIQLGLAGDVTVEETAFKDANDDETVQENESAKKKEIEGSDIYAAAVKQNAKFIREEKIKSVLNNSAESMLKNFRAGRLLIRGRTRFLMPDMLRFMYHIAKEHLRAEKSKLTEKLLSEEEKERLSKINQLKSEKARLLREFFYKNEINEIDKEIAEKRIAARILKNEEIYLRNESFSHAIHKKIKIISSKILELKAEENDLEAEKTRLIEESLCGRAKERIKEIDKSISGKEADLPAGKALSAETENSIKEIDNKIEDIRNKEKTDCIPSRYFYAPKMYVSDKNKNKFSIVRNPHVSRNEHVTSKMIIPDENSMIYKYLRHLQGVCMVNPIDCYAERLAGADYDGDICKIYESTDFTALAEHSNDIIEFDGDYIKSIKPGLAMIEIPNPTTKANSEKIEDETEWNTVVNTFSNSVGRYSNYAFNLGAIAYNKNKAGENKIENPEDAVIENPEDAVNLMTILVGLEIDSAKTGKKPYIPKEYKKLEKEYFLYVKDSLAAYGSYQKWNAPKDSCNLNKLQSLIDKKKKRAAKSDSIDIKELLNADKLKKIPAEQQKSMAALFLAYVDVTGAFYKKEKVFHEYTDLIKKILEKQGRFEELEEEDIDEMRSEILAGANISNLYELLDKQREMLWAFNPPEKREQALKDIFKACRVELICENFDMLTDFRFSGYDILAYMLKAELDEQKAAADASSSKSLDILRANALNADIILAREIGASKLLKEFKSKSADIIKGGGQNIKDLKKRLELDAGDPDEPDIKAIGAKADAVINIMGFGEETELYKILTANIEYKYSAFYFAASWILAEYELAAEEAYRNGLYDGFNLLADKYKTRLKTIKIKMKIKNKELKKIKVKSKMRSKPARNVRGSILKASTVNENCAKLARKICVSDDVLAGAFLDKEIIALNKKYKKNNQFFWVCAGKTAAEQKYIKAFAYAFPKAERGGDYKYMYRDYKTEEIIDFDK